MKEQATLQNLSDFENKSLLICDDDNPFRERLARAMEKKGFEVFQAESVQKGVEAVKAKKPGFAVVDLRLGDGNGLEVVKEIQTSNNDSRIIMLTGYGNIPTAVAAIKEGAIAYIHYKYRSLRPFIERNHSSSRMTSSRSRSSLNSSRSSLPLPSSSMSLMTA